MAPEFLDTDMHPPTPIGDEAVDVFEPNEEDIMATGILDDSDAEASDDEATSAPRAAESHVHEVADVEEPKQSKLAALGIVYGQRPPTCVVQISINRNKCQNYSLGSTRTALAPVFTGQFRPGSCVHWPVPFIL